MREANLEDAVGLVIAISGELLQLLPPHGRERQCVPARVENGRRQQRGRVLQRQVNGEWSRVVRSLLTRGWEAGKARHQGATRRRIYKTTKAG